MSVILTPQRYNISNFAARPDGSWHGQDPSGVGGALTSDGTDTAIVLNNNSSYDDSKVGPRVIIKAGSTYYCFYEGIRQSDGYGQICYATASSLTGSWTKQGVALSPLPPSTWEGDELSPNSMFYDEVTGEWNLFYHGGGNSLDRQIGRATTTDFSTWVRDSNNPIIVNGGASSFDENICGEPRILRLPDRSFRMYYTGQNSSNLQSLGFAYANSLDGPWTKYGSNPIINNSDWGNQWGGAFFLDKNRMFHLWHAVQDTTNHLLYKWSLDGIAWNDGYYGPVYSESSDPESEEYSIGDSVSGFYESNRFSIFFGGFNTDWQGLGLRFSAPCSAYIDRGAEI